MIVPVPNPSKDVTLQRVGQEAILHDRRSGRAHVINETAAEIWELCDGRATPEQIAVTLAESYDLTASVIQQDVNDILATFRQLQVLD